MKNIGFLRDKKLDFLRPRREKTESELVVRQSATRQGLRDNLEARRIEVENRFSKEADEFRRRSARPLDINNSNSTKQIDVGEYTYLQVTCFLHLISSN